LLVYTVPKSELKDIPTIEQIQRRAMKYILNNFTSCYKTKLNPLPLLYMFKLQDLLFTVKSIKSPTIQFNNYVQGQEPSTNSYHHVTLTIHPVNLISS